VKFKPINYYSSRTDVVTKLSALLIAGSFSKT